MLRLLWPGQVVEVPPDRGHRVLELGEGSWCGRSPSLSGERSQEGPGKDSGPGCTEGLEAKAGRAAFTLNALGAPEKL